MQTLRFTLKDQLYRKMTDISARIGGGIGLILAWSLLPLPEPVLIGFILLYLSESSFWFVGFGVGVYLLNRSK